VLAAAAKRQFLICRRPFASRTKRSETLETFLVDPTHRLPARHDKSGDRTRIEKQALVISHG